MADGRVFPLIEVSRDELARLIKAPVAKVDRVDGGLTNTIHKVTTEAGDVLAVKHYSGGRDAFEASVRDLGVFAARWPKAVDALITGRFPLEAHRELLLGTPSGVKNVITFAS